MKKVAIILGTRPEVLKNYSIVRALEKTGVPHCILHTGQHFDPLMRSDVFDSLGYQPTEVFPGKYRMGAVLDWTMDRLGTFGSDTVLVHGDTAAAVIGALAAIYSDLELAHVEAGLRSFDTRMYEERNRIMVDAAAHYLFADTHDSAKYLRGCTAHRGQIIQSGNTTVDLLQDFADQFVKPPYSDYAFVTLHRRELLNSRTQLLTVLSALQYLSQHFETMIFPVHPHTQHRMRQYRLKETDFPEIRFVDPMPPLEALGCIRDADVVITDGGVVQEEAYILNVPCVTVRENTERQCTLEWGANILAGLSRTGIIHGVVTQLNRVTRRYPAIYGSYGVGERIVGSLMGGFGAASDEENQAIRLP